MAAVPSVEAAVERDNKKGAKSPKDLAPFSYFSLLYICQMLPLQGPLKIVSLRKRPSVSTEIKVYRPSVFLTFIPTL